MAPSIYKFAGVKITKIDAYYQNVIFAENL